MHICVEFNKFDVNVRLCAHTKNGPEQRTRWEVRERERKSHNLVRIHTELLIPRTTNGKIKNRANKKIVCFRVDYVYDRMIEMIDWLIDCCCWNRRCWRHWRSRCRRLFSCISYIQFYFSPIYIYVWWILKSSASNLHEQREWFSFDNSEFIFGGCVKTHEK